MEALRQSSIEWGVACQAPPGEPFSGDRHVLRASGNGALCAVIDGLGHGAGAVEAAKRAARVFERDANEDPVRLLEHCHEDLRETSGAVASVASLDLAAGRLVWL